MKFTRYSPILNVGHSPRLRAWLGQPVVSMPSVSQLLEECIPMGCRSNKELAATLSEDEKSYYVEFELPGVKKDAVKVELNEGVLAVSAERRGSGGAKAEQTDAFRSEVRLPKDVDPGAITAALEDGILTVSVPKQQRRKPQVIQVN